MFLFVVFPAFARIAGDVDNSDAVDAMDVQLVINGALKLSVPYPVDIDQSGSVDAMDVQLVIYAALHIMIDPETPSQTETILLPGGVPLVMVLSRFSGNWTIADFSKRLPSVVATRSIVRF